MPHKKVTTITIYFKSLVPIDGKSKSSKISSNSTGAKGSTAHSGGPPPDVVSSNSPSKSKSASSSPGKPKGPEKVSPKAVGQLQERLAEALKTAEERGLYASGLRNELVEACRGVEGFGVVTQYLSQLLDDSRQQLAESRQTKDILERSHHEELSNYHNESDLLTKNHVEEKRAVMTSMTEQHNREMSKLKALQAHETERLREELADLHNAEMCRLNAESSQQRDMLQKEIEALRQECEDWKVRYDQATDALHKDMDHRLQIALQPYTQLPQEIESLKTAIELKSAEIRYLRSENNVYKQKVEIIPDLDKKLYDTEQRLENVQALLDIVSAKEKETAEKYHKITRKAVLEKKENHRLSLNMEALELKLEEAEFTNSIHLDPGPGDLDISSVSLPPYSIDNPDTSPSQFTRSFSRSSMKRRSQQGSTNNNSIEIPEDERQISPAKHLVFRSPSSSPSPTRVSSPRKPHSAGAVFTSSPNHRASTLPRSYRHNRLSDPHS